MDYENQTMLEHMFNEKQASKLVRHELTQSQYLMELIDQACAKFSHLHQEYCMALMIHLALNKRAAPDALIGLLHHLFSPTSDRPSPWQSSATALEQAVKADLVDLDMDRGEHGQIVVRYMLDNATESLVRQYQYMPPMIVPPLPAGHSGNNRGSGYVTITTDSLILQDRFNHHEGHVCPDVLDLFNQVPLTLNIEVAKGINNQWSSLDKPKPDETWDDFRDRTRAFERYQQDAAFTMALMQETGNRFYITHKVDKRGRVYAQGYHINPQGTCWNKAVIELADKELIQ